MATLASYLARLNDATSQELSGRLERHQDSLQVLNQEYVLHVEIQEPYVEESLHEHMGTGTYS